MVVQSLHDAFVRAAENKADSGGTNRRIRRSVTIESGTVAEKVAQDALERYLEAVGGDDRTDVRIEDIGRVASVSTARLKASMGIYLTANAIREVAVRCGLTALLRWLDEEGGMAALDAMLKPRHAHVHSLAHGSPDDVGACATVGELLHAALDGRPADLVVALLVEGSIMDMAGRVDDARAAYEAALAICRVHMDGRRENAWAHVCAGHALAHLGMAGEAEAALWDAIRADPDSPLAYLELGHLALLDGRYGDAGVMYARSAEIDPSYAPAYVFRGNALLMTEGADGRLAVKMYDGAPVVDPYDITAPMGRGLSLAGRGLHAEAAVHFERAIDVDPDDAVPRVALGHAMAALGCDAEAAWAYATAIEAGERTGLGIASAGVRIDRASRLGYRLGGVSAHLGLADVLSGTGRHGDALAYCREAADLDPSSAGAHAGAARSLVALGRWEEAVPAYRRAAELDPGSARAHLGLADSLSNTNRPEEAVPAYRRAAELDPGSARAHLGLADSLSNTNRPEEAISAYRTAIGLDQHNAEAHLGLADALSMTGWSTEAQWAYERAAALDPGIERRYYGTSDGWGV